MVMPLTTHFIEKAEFLYESQKRNQCRIYENETIFQIFLVRAS
jgi:hypothetical protein